MSQPPNTVRYFIEPAAEDPHARYPCGTCQRVVGVRNKAIQCEVCNYWNHIGCDGISPYDYEKLKKLPQVERDKIIHFCKRCMEDALPFQKLSDDEFITSIIKNIVYQEDLNLRICPPNGLKRLFTDFSNHNEDEPVTINCDYYDTSSKIPNLKGPNLSMFHMNIASLGLHKEELEAALSLLEVDFDIIAITETKIIKDINPIYDVKLKGYDEPYHIPTESFKGGAMIYVKEGIEVKRRPDLESKMYESGKLETVFLEIMNTNKKNIIFGCVYRHPSMDINSFNEKYLNNTIAKLTEEKKICYLAGDFNIDLLKSDTDDHTKDFLTHLHLIFLYLILLSLLELPIDPKLL